ncbi:uncharacterized protein K444DRAFT_627355 [Hyaloscypha bicolor E]|uniref:Uncharacterized protein n=1 Tax=Hyaloscypha bicolor E TaxID=1095630 RepID=A0A2J6THA8_9HELO|nr:uncharacterized protein K444DRAFT_627355 [Hyaloscypha bicolor E]PMD62419.1 hypothetical protein K444DRAFT_627355 [Hyaloscypha bicolor E]
MHDSAVANVHNYFLSSNIPDATPTALPAPSNGSYQDVVYEPHKYTLVDRLRGIFSVAVPEKKRAIVDQRSLQTQQESNGDSSPWILPVYVLSTRQDKDKHHIAMEAKCTIDTGNMQGNIVSRKFIGVLEYPESAFCPLTKEEEAGATSVTGHQLIPQGAIHLTWYHKKSTRVFRDMRFLISPNENFDLIIGAWSIQKDRILDVPNLMVDKVFMPLLTDFPLEDPTHEALRDRKHNIEERIGDLQTEIHDAVKANKPKEVERLRKRKAILKEEQKFWTNAKGSDAEIMNHLDKLRELKAELIREPPPPYTEAKNDLHKEHSEQSGSG